MGLATLSVLLLLAGLGALIAPAPYEGGVLLELDEDNAIRLLDGVGAALILVAVGIAFAETAIVMRVILIILFLFLTAPLAAHMIARAGYRSGVPLVEETVVDEYRAREGA